jgi:hypothetical protein
MIFLFIHLTRLEGSFSTTERLKIKHITYSPMWALYKSGAGPAKANCPVSP